MGEVVVRVAQFYCMPFFQFVYPESDTTKHGRTILLFQEKCGVNDNKLDAHFPNFFGRINWPHSFAEVRDKEEKVAYVTPPLSSPNLEKGTPVVFWVV